MKAIILAAGYATRLYPLTANFPKPLLPVNNKPILNYFIEDLNEFIEEFIVLSNHKFIDHFNNWKNSHSENIRIIDDGTSDNEHRLGAVKDIELALKYIGDEDVLVMAGDNVLDFSLKGFIGFYKKVNTSVVMAHHETRLEKLQKTAVITVDENDLITSYEEKPKEPKGELAVPPFYIYRNKDVRRISEALSDGCGYDAPGSFAAWLSNKTPMHAYKMPGERFDIGDMKSYEYIKDTYKGIQ